MPAKDIFHDCVKTALIKDGWTITHDPLSLRIGKKDLFVDLGAEQLLAAEKESRKIAIEIKSFVSPSEMRDLAAALGQYVLYQNVLSALQPDRILYLAVRESVFIDLFEEEVGKLLLERQVVKLFTFDPNQEAIARWIS
jgi:XisH protein